MKAGGIILAVISLLFAGIGIAFMVVTHIVHPLWVLLIGSAIVIDVLWLCEVIE